MLSFDWRVPEEYRYTAKIPAAGFAWEYLRRNDEYRHDFDTLIATKQPARQAGTEDVCTPLGVAISTRCLTQNRFPGFRSFNRAP